MAPNLVLATKSTFDLLGAAYNWPVVDCHPWGDSCGEEPTIPLEVQNGVIGGKGRPPFTLTPCQQISQQGLHCILTLSPVLFPKGVQPLPAPFIIFLFIGLHSFDSLSHSVHACSFVEQHAKVLTSPALTEAHRYESG